ncbi:MAG: YdiU family protein [Acidimicrobiales bacterium]
MAATATPLLELGHRYADLLPELVVDWQGAEVPAPTLLVLNDALAVALGLDVDALRSPDGVAVLSGSVAPAGARPVALAYAGHQFGGYSPRLGDGRALLLGELPGPDGGVVDLHLKGSGRTPFARGGDGKAAVGPMLREHLIGEAMHALGVPTTRSLAVAATGEQVRREEGPLPGAVLARVASSHLRVGTFQYAASLDDRDLLERLADHAIERHHPHAADAPNRFLALYDAVVTAQAELVARWMHVGFVHGVMNTDNTTISGETIDYGPCAFLDAHDPSKAFSSIDHGGRYAFGHQPAIVQWNLARLAEALLPLIDDDQEAAVAAATEVLQALPARFGQAWRAGMRTKLGLTAEHEADGDLFDGLLRTMHEQAADHTSTFRALATVVRGDRGPARAQFRDPAAFDAWSEDWLERVAAEGRPADEAARDMDAVNPIYIPRNHLVDEALTAATAGDLTSFHELSPVLAAPYEERPGLERYALGATREFSACFQTFCGT